jgi:hypothetical protein
MEAFENKIEKNCTAPIKNGAGCCDKLNNVFIPIFCREFEVDKR